MPAHTSNEDTLLMITAVELVDGIQSIRYMIRICREDGNSEIYGKTVVGRVINISAIEDDRELLAEKNLDHGR